MIDFINVWMQLSVHVLDLRNVITCVLRFVFSLVNAVRIMKFYMLCSSFASLGCIPRGWNVTARYQVTQVTFTPVMQQEGRHEEAYAQFKKLEIEDPRQQKVAVEPIVKDDKKENLGFQFCVKDVVLCCLIVVVLMQAYYLYKQYVLRLYVQV